MEYNLMFYIRDSKGEYHTKCVDGVDLSNIKIVIEKVTESAKTIDMSVTTIDMQPLET